MDQHFCTACGHQLGAGDLFCTACGARAAESTASVAPAPTPAPAAAETPAETTAVRRDLPPYSVRKRRSRARFWGWIAVAAVLVAIVSFALGTLAGGSGSGGDSGRGMASGSTGVSTGALSSRPAAPSAVTSPDPQALGQARALHALIAHSASDKQRIAVAAAQLQACKHVPQAISTFEEAAASRERLVDQAGELQVGLLPGGGAAIASFSKALRAAADADRAYVAWGHTRHRVKHHDHVSCRGGKDLERTAVRLSTASHGPKQQAANGWNVIAEQFGLPKIVWTSL